MTIARKVRMRIVRNMSTGESFDTPTWLERADHEFDNGVGAAWLTEDPILAMIFENNAAALEFWQKLSITKPVRDDGGINRPLTAYTIILEAVP